MSDTTYNGWKNYPTWCVNLWLDNDQGTQEWALEIVRDATEDASHPRYGAATALRDQVRGWIEEEDNLSLTGPNASCASDLLGYALDCVDWYELADAWITNYEESA